MSKHLVVKSYPNNVRVLKSMLVGALNGVTVEYAPDFQMGKDNKEPSFLDVNPFGQVPTAFVNDGKDGVFESNSIARYAARLGQSTRPLYGKNDLEASRIDAYLDTEMGFVVACSDWFYPLIGYGTADPEKTKASQEKAKKYLKGLEYQLAKTPYLMGDAITLADIVIFTTMIGPFTIAFNQEFLADVPQFVAWFNRIKSTPELTKLVEAAEESFRQRKK